MGEGVDCRLKITPSGVIFNHLQNGAIQIVHGRKQPGIGVGDRASADEFAVNLVNGEGKTVRRTIPSNGALSFNGFKVREKLQEMNVSKDQIETEDIIQLFGSIGIVDIELDNRIFINGQPQQNITIKEDYLGVIEPEDNSIIDITEFANPKSDKKVKKDDYDS